MRYYRIRLNRMYDLPLCGFRLNHTKLEEDLAALGEAVRLVKTPLGEECALPKRSKKLEWLRQLEPRLVEPTLGALVSFDVILATCHRDLCQGRRCIRMSVRRVLRGLNQSARRN